MPTGELVDPAATALTMSWTSPETSCCASRRLRQPRRHEPVRYCTITPRIDAPNVGAWVPVVRTCTSTPCDGAAELAGLDAFRLRPTRTTTPPTRASGTSRWRAAGAPSSSTKLQRPGDSAGRGRSSRSSAFADTNLDLLLRSNGIRTQSGRGLHHGGLRRVKRARRLLLRLLPGGRQRLGPAATCGLHGVAAGDGHPCRADVAHRLGEIVAAWAGAEAAR